MAVLGERQPVTLREVEIVAGLLHERVAQALVIALVHRREHGQHDGDVNAAAGALMIVADDLRADLKHGCTVDLGRSRRHGRPVDIAPGYGRTRRSDRDDRSRPGAFDGVAMRTGILGIVHAHDRIAAAEQRHARGRACLQPLERGQRRLGAPERLIGGRRIDDAASVHPRVGIAGAHRAQHAVTRVSMAVDQPGQHGLAMRIEGPLRGEALTQRFGAADGNDAVREHGDRAVLDHPAHRVHRDHGAALDQQVDGVSHVRSLEPLANPVAGARRTWRTQVVVPAKAGTQCLGARNARSIPGFPLRGNDG